MMKNPNVVEIQALLAYAKVGVEMLGARILSILALFGIFALGGYVVYASSWQGVAVVVAIAYLVVRPVLASETGQRAEPAKE